MNIKLLPCLALVLCGVLVYAAFLFIYEPSPVQKLSGAAMQGNLEILKKLEAKGVSLDARNEHAFGWTPLMAAIYMQQTNMIQYLLTRNTNLNAQDTSGNTALMWAISIDDTNTVRLLLEKGAEVTINGKSGDAFACANVESGNARNHRDLYLGWLNAYKDKNKTSAKP
jgi:ankyrin repeat protein